MPRPSPFHPRTSDLCTSLAYKEWAGCHAVRRYDTCHLREYHALRNAAAVMDATPLYKVDIHGADAARFLSRVTVRSAEDQAEGQVRYLCWCDENGKVLDDGTLTRLSGDHFRLTSAEPCLYWLERCARSFKVTLEDTSREIAVLSLQGPRSRDVLSHLAGDTVASLGFFRAAEVQVGGHGILVTRTGYTGDLGFELWVPNEGALALWDAVHEAGTPHGLLPMGLDALDVARIEAGFILQGVEYHSARTALIEARTATPFELGLGWAVKLERDPFVGQQALQRARAQGPVTRLVGLAINWDGFEELHTRHGLPPDVPAEACREGVPLYLGGRQVGRATSRAWSPILKRYLALGFVEPALAQDGTRLSIEVTVEYERLLAPALVVPRPFFNPERKRA